MHLKYLKRFSVNSCNDETIAEPGYFWLEVDSGFIILSILNSGILQVHFHSLIAFCWKIKKNWHWKKKPAHLHISGVIKGKTNLFVSSCFHWIHRGWKFRSHCYIALNWMVEVVCIIISLNIVLLNKKTKLLPH